MLFGRKGGEKRIAGSGDREEGEEVPAINEALKGKREASGLQTPLEWYFELQQADVSHAFELSIIASSCSSEMGST